MAKTGWVIVVFLLCWCMVLPVKAEDTVEDEIEYYDFSKIEQVLEKEEVDFSFEYILY